MPKTLALITIHGMGETSQNYYLEFVNVIKSAVNTATWEQVAFKAIYYQNILQGSQEEIFHRMRDQIDWMRLRKFLLYGFSDAASLEYKKDFLHSPYYETQKEILRTLDALFDEAGQTPVPIIILAHSLGCQIISNYLWDAQQTKATAGIWSVPLEDGVVEGSPRDQFRRMRTVERFYTTGCNIPIFVAGHKTIEAITPPHQRFQWHNFFDEDDVLGWPLRPLSRSYARLVEDIAINAGGGLLGTLVKSWNPFSHGQYWTDFEVTRHITAAINQLV